jgi:hypothetical protein
MIMGNGIQNAWKIINEFSIINETISQVRIAALRHTDES